MFQEPTASIGVPAVEHFEPMLRPELFAATDICERRKNGIQDITPYVPMAAKANPADEIETCVNCRASEAGNLGVRTGRQTQ